MVGWRKVIVCCLLIAMLLPLGCFGTSSAKAAESSPNLSNASAVYFYHLVYYETVFLEKYCSRCRGSAYCQRMCK